MAGSALPANRTPLRHLRQFRLTSTPQSLRCRKQTGLFPMWEWLAGAIRCGQPLVYRLALSMGNGDNFRQFAGGCRAMDEHFMQAPRTEHARGNGHVVVF